jgi:two-component system phosphate regulon sensor histidine kinase PhoR
LGFVAVFFISYPSIHLLFFMKIKLTKPGVVFGIVTAYIIAAFAWWIVAHIRSSNKLYFSEKERMELSCYKASAELNAALSQELFEDTAGARKYLNTNFPELEVLFDEGDFPLEQFLIRPSQESYLLLNQRHDRTIRMYILEGVVMIGLLFWGIIWIYSNLQNKLKLKRQQSNFLLSITHELKTPLASIKLYLETLHKRTLDKEQANTIIGNSLGDVERLRDLVDNILLAAQLDIHKYELQLRETNISEIIQKTVNRYVVPRALQERVKLTLEENVFLTTDEGALEMVVSNLLSNAIKYSQPAGSVEINLHTDEEYVYLSVRDEGQGISLEDKAMIFSKFYRTGDEQTRKTKGTGLGLFIVKNLMELLKGEIRVKDRQPKGTIFELIFKQDAPDIIS